MTSVNDASRNALVLCDVHPRSGLGHLMRSLSFSDALSKDFKITFGINNSQKYVKDFVSKAGFESLVLNSYKNPRFELNEVLQLIKKMNHRLVIHDSYYMSTQDLSKIRHNIRMLIDFDDLRKKKNPADIIYNPHLVRKSTGRKLFGLDFLALPKEIIKYKKRNTSKTVKTILLCFGGTDPKNLTQLALELLSGSSINFTKTNICVVIGPFNKNRDLLIKKWKKKVVFIEKSNNLWPYMRDSDLAITSGGSVKYELSSIGVPVISIASNEIEDFYSKQFARLGMSIHLGTYKNIDKESSIKKIDALVRDVAARKKMVDSGRKYFRNNNKKKIRRSVMKRYSELMDERAR